MIDQIDPFWRQAAGAGQTGTEDTPPVPLLWQERVMGDGANAQPGHELG